MAAGRTTVAPRRTSGDGVPQLELIGHPDLPVPRWTRSWCAQTGFDLVRFPTAAEPAIDLEPEASGWPRVILEVAAATAAGGTVLVRRPSWLGPGAPVVAAVEDLPDDTDVLVDAAACAAALGVPLRLVHAVPVSFAERSIGLDTAVSHGRAVLDAAVSLATARRPAVETTTTLLRVHPYELVNSGLDAEVLVVGGSRIGPSRRLGRVAISAIQHAGCSVMVVPRAPAEPARSG